MNKINWEFCGQISCKEDYEFINNLAKNQYKILDREILSLEIGTYKGASAAILAQYGPVLAIDLWGDHLDCLSNYNTIGQVTFLPFIQGMIKLNLIGRVFPIVSTSEFLNFLPPISFDIIFIDADHSYEAVKLDLERSKRHLNNKGLFIFHDYFEDLNRPHVGVKKAVDELLKEGEFVVYDLFQECICLRRKI